MNLFGVGLPEMGLVFVLALILIGPQRFPEIARQAGRWYRMARAFTDEVMTDVRAAVDEIEDEIGITEDANGGIRPIRELQDLRRDLDEAIAETAQIRRDAETAAAGEAADVPPSDEPAASTAADGEREAGA